LSTLSTRIITIGLPGDIPLLGVCSETRIIATYLLIEEVFQTLEEINVETQMFAPNRLADVINNIGTFRSRSA
jgi:hypothetical protein